MLESLDESDEKKDKKACADCVGVLIFDSNGNMADIALINYGGQSTIIGGGSGGMSDIVQRGDGTWARRGSPDDDGTSPPPNPQSPED